jgi:hypothetical protein
MPKFALSNQFERKLKKQSGKDRKLSQHITDALEKFGRDPVPNSLHFKPVSGTKNLHYIRIPKRHGWRIIFRKLELKKEVVYEAIDFGNHDVRRDGN